MTHTKYLFTLLLLVACREYDDGSPQIKPLRDPSDERPVKIVVKNTDPKCKEYDFGVHVIYTRDSIGQSMYHESYACNCEIKFPVEHGFKYRVVGLGRINGSHSPSYNVKLLNSRDSVIYTETVSRMEADKTVLIP